MDNTAVRTQDKHFNVNLSARIFFVILVFIAAVFAFCGMKLYDGAEYSFYKRYGGDFSVDCSADFVSLIGDVLHHALPSLALTMTLFLSSFSPFLVPFSIIAIAIRGFVIGVAFAYSGNNAFFPEVVLYTAVTIAICAMCTILRTYGKSGKDTTRNICARIFLMLCVSGIIVLGEAAMSFIS